MKKKESNKSQKIKWIIARCWVSWEKKKILLFVCVILSVLYDRIWQKSLMELIEIFDYNCKHTLEEEEKKTNDYYRK